eukprot:Lankesteria_metandrocarpae@DN5735_c0_g1_i1.p1
MLFVQVMRLVVCVAALTVSSWAYERDDILTMHNGIVYKRLGLTEEIDKSWTAEVIDGNMTIRSGDRRVWCSNQIGSSGRYSCHDVAGVVLRICKRTAGCEFCSEDVSTDDLRKTFRKYLKINGDRVTNTFAQNFEVRFKDGRPSPFPSDFAELLKNNMKALKKHNGLPVYYKGFVQRITTKRGRARKESVEELILQRRYDSTNFFQRGFRFLTRHKLYVIADVTTFRFRPEGNKNTHTRENTAQAAAQPLLVSEVPFPAFFLNNKNDAVYELSVLGSISNSGVTNPVVLFKMASHRTEFVSRDCDNEAAYQFYLPDYPAQLLL